MSETNERRSIENTKRAERSHLQTGDFEISSVSSKHYNKEEISKNIHTKWAGNTVHFAVETDSTNEWIKRLAAEGAAHGTLAVTEYQSGGKGRLGRKWVAPAGSSIMMSLLLRPQFPPTLASMLTLVMGLSAAQAIETAGLETSIKWPNDVVVSRKKVSGILTEMELEGDRIREVIIGIGINVNLKEIPDDLQDKATSLCLETGKVYNRTILLGEILRQFEYNYELFVKNLDLRLLMDEYHRLLANRDQPVQVLAKEPFAGIARGINAKGELLVETSDGTKVHVNSGEVSVRGLYSYV